ncbi:T-cell surface glycoprotein CD4-like isoform X2 [Parambassis ranga]|nr:T-cell surface glycoprotein CD4-like isoform X2 [Parambassis ranga]
MKMIVWMGLVLGALSAAGDVIVAKVGDTRELRCGDGSMQPTVSWYRGNELILEHASKGLPRKGAGDIVKRSSLRNKHLKISGLTEADGGKFRCNVDGTDKAVHTLVVISVWVTPSGALLVGSAATLQCKVSKLDSGPSVEWTGPDGQSHKESQVVLSAVAASDAGSWQCKIIYEGTVIHTESLNIAVTEPALATTKSTTRSNSKGDVDNPTCLNCDTLPSDAVFLGLKWWIWLAIGVSSIVVILLIVCVIVTCIRIRRKKRKYLKMKQAQQELRTRKYCRCDRPTAAAKPLQQGRRREKPSALPL